MNFDNTLLQLINSNSPQVNNFRQKAINGNQQILQSFLNVIMKFLNNNNHKAAYYQINQLLISAKPQIASELDRNILPTIQKKHCFQNLDKYVLFWKRIMNGSATKNNYPNLYERFKFTKLKAQNTKLSNKFLEFQNKFQKNLSEVLAQKVQFFEDFDGDSFATQSVSNDNISYIIQLDMQQIKQIRQQVQNGPVDELIAEQFAIKVKNFLSLNPQLVKVQQIQQFNNQRVWSRWFIQNYKNYMKNNYLNFYQKKQEVRENQTYKILALPQQNRQNIDFHTGKSIKIWEQAEEINIQQKEVKKMNRFTKVSEKNINIQNQMRISQNISLQETNKKLNLTEPQFILDTHEMKKIISQNQGQLSMNNSKVRPKIFGNNSRISQISRISQQEQPLQTQLVVTKHSKQDYKFMKKKQNLNERPKSSSFRAIERPTQSYRYTQNKNIVTNQANLILQENRQSFNASHVNYYNTPIGKRNNFNNQNSPNTGFLYKTSQRDTPYRKLSQLKEQKRQRKLGLANEELGAIESYLFVPYYQFFTDNVGFSRFRRNCFEDCFLLYSSSLLIATCTISRLANSKTNVQIVYQNKSKNILSLQTLYRIPKCLKIQKNSKITKKCSLKDKIVHSFSLQISQFPLQPCTLNLKYVRQQNSQILSTQSPINVLLPFTIRNFIEAIVLNQYQFIDKWTTWTQNENFRLLKNIILQPLVMNQGELQMVLRDLTLLSPIQGYSFKQFGGYFIQSSFQNLTFLLRISQRVGTILTLQLLANRKTKNQDQIDFIQYCLNIWSMLLAKIQSPNY